MDIKCVDRQTQEEHTMRGTQVESTKHDPTWSADFGDERFVRCLLMLRLWVLKNLAVATGIKSPRERRSLDLNRHAHNSSQTRYSHTLRNAWKRQFSSKVCDMPPSSLPPPKKKKNLVHTKLFPKLYGHLIIFPFL